MWIVCLIYKGEDKTSKIEPTKSESVHCDTFRDTIVLNHTYFLEKEDIY